MSSFFLKQQYYKNIFHWQRCENDRKKPGSSGSACFIRDAVLHCISDLRSRFHSPVPIGSVQGKRCDYFCCGIVVHQSDECYRYTFYHLDRFFEFKVLECYKIIPEIKPSQIIVSITCTCVAIKLLLGGNMVLMPEIPYWWLCFLYKINNIFIQTF